MRTRLRFRGVSWPGRSPGSYWFAPLIARLFTAEVRWGIGDFVLAGLLIVGTGLTYGVAIRTTRDFYCRAGVGVGLAAAFLLVWVNAAVGTIEAAGNDVNMLYWGVISVGGLGAILSRGQPRGVALGVLAAAVAQMIVAVIAVAAGWGQPASGALEVLELNGAFAILSLTAAGLFWRAEPRGSSP